MKQFSIISLAIIFGGIYNAVSSNRYTEKVLINFGGSHWIFPSTIEEAVKKHDLNYKPTGYYYKSFPENNMEVILFYNYYKNDFDNEYQPKEALFPRNLNSYIFRFYEKEGMYDSLKHLLENTYNNKFILVKSDIDLKYPNAPKNDFDFMKITPSTVVGIKRNKDYDGKNKIVVRFFYEMTQDDISVDMGSF